MGTLGDLEARIADELNRTDLDSQINLAVQSAIDFYAAETMWFQEERASDTTIANQEYYLLPTDYVTINSLRVTINTTNDYLLISRTNGYFENVYQPSSVYVGYPQDYTIYDKQLRLGPIPNGIYPMTLHYIKSLANLSTDTSINEYTERLAEQLIRARAKADLAANVIRDYQTAAAQKAQESEILAQLRKKSTLYMSNSSIERYL